MAQEHFDRLTAIDASFLHQEGPNSHMHVGAADDLRGPAAAVRRVPRPHPRAPAPRPALPPEARRTRRSRPAGRCGSTTRRFNLEYHVRHTALPAPGHRGAAAAPHRADLLPAARPLQAAVGDVAGRGARGRPLRADLQDPPRADRRHRRRRPRDGAVRPLARARRRRRTPTRPWQPRAASRRRAELARRRASRGVAAHGASTLAAGARRRARAPRARARRARARRPRASARSSGPA